MSHHPIRDMIDLSIIGATGIDDVLWPPISFDNGNDGDPPNPPPPTPSKLKAMPGQLKWITQPFETLRFIAATMMYQRRLHTFTRGYYSQPWMDYTRDLFVGTTDKNGVLYVSYIMLCLYFVCDVHIMWTNCFIFLSHSL